MLLFFFVGILLWHRGDVYPTGISWYDVDSRRIIQKRLYCERYPISLNIITNIWFLNNEPVYYLYNRFEFRLTGRNKRYWWTNTIIWFKYSRFLFMQLHERFSLFRRHWTRKLEDHQSGIRNVLVDEMTVDIFKSLLLALLCDHLFPYSTTKKLLIARNIIKRNFFCFSLIKKKNHSVVRICLYSVITRNVLYLFFKICNTFWIAAIPISTVKPVTPVPRCIY